MFVLASAVYGDHDQLIPLMEAEAAKSRELRDGEFIVAAYRRTAGFSAIGARHH
jgi:hypothetical protein